jgi:hypothetical protein
MSACCILENLQSQPSRLTPLGELLELLPITLHEVVMGLIIFLCRHMDAMLLALCINKGHHIRPHRLLAILLLLSRHDEIAPLRSVSHVDGALSSSALEIVGSAAVTGSGGIAAIGLTARVECAARATSSIERVEVVAVCTACAVDGCAEWTTRNAAEGHRYVSALFAGAAAVSRPESEVGGETERYKDGEGPEAEGCFQHVR